VLHHSLALNDSVMLSAHKNELIKQMTHYLEVAFAFSSLIAGAMAIFLEKQWFRSIDDSWKVPLYGMMGASFSFLLIYSMVEVVEIIKELLDGFGQWMFGLRQAEPRPAYIPLVIINLQYFVLLLSSLLSGGIFGSLFGVIDIEKFIDAGPLDLFWAASTVEIFIFAPVGFIHGAFVGLLFMTLRFLEKNRRGITHGYGGAYKGYQEVQRHDDSKPLMPSGASPIRDNFTNFDHVLLSDSDEETFTMNL
jgi:hypothetical protein